MDPRQIKVSFSVGAKLLISAVGLLLTVITFLDVSTILLLREDKEAYTFQMQATESVLAGREFVNLFKSSIDTLKATLSAIDPKRPLNKRHDALIHSILDNQNRVLGIDIRLFDQDLKSGSNYARIVEPAPLTKFQLKPNDLQTIDSDISKSKELLLEQGYAVNNMTKEGGAPLLRVILLDRESRGSSNRLPLVIGYVSLAGLGDEVKNSSILITDIEGSVVYNSDSSATEVLEGIADHPLFQTASQSKLVSGAQKFDHSGSHFLGSYYQPGYGFYVLAQLPWDVAMEATYALTERFILLGLMVIGAAIIFAILFSKRLTSPLSRLTDATNTVASGNFDLKLPVSGTDEISALSGSFNVMSAKIKQLIAETAEKAHLESELEIASTVQQTLIPPSEFKNPKINIDSHYEPASQCGGDWWGFFGVKNKFTIMIADATGHGMPSALITASARSCFSVMHKLAQEDREFSFSPASMLDYANRVIHDASMSKIMMTFFIAVIDFDQMEITYANAGHNPPWLFKKTNDKYKLKSLVVPGQRLGESRNAPPYEEKSVSISPGDVLFLYTDGVTEGMNTKEEMFNKKRMRKVIEKEIPNGTKPMIESLVKAFRDHVGDKPLDDDITIAAATIGSGGN